ncbi:HAMP domain-containing methyl-accepting chemotaxis protein [Nitrospirillum sp. BR 11163]|uniref:methyl-accepting chemotaxis protein n=1 Tax=Nitrospirillum sp. BR 11163 TaxID=3104323 RepID=UPI002AFFF7C0|nr:HAMP domain-containing methyl-accepting chemotaxis protein [Nitrospirillum sp. BR 11163]MEA1676153.1 HAMP domain-containing methyl-accepting chemotaxis protein [Nitrospirillum sp. BR 11163]
MTLWLNLSLRAKVLTSFLAVLFLIAALGGTSLWTQATLGRTTDTLAGAALPNAVRLGELMESLNRYRRLELRLALAAAVHDAADVQGAEADLPKTRAAVEAAIRDYAAKAGADNPDGQRAFTEAWQRYTAATAKLVTLIDAHDDAGMQSFASGPLKDAFRAVISPLTDALEWNARHGRELAQSANATGEAARTAVLGALAASLALGVVVILAMSRTVARPLTAMADALGRLARGDVAEGDLDVTLLGQDRRDEVGLLGRSLAVFRDNALAVRRLEAEQAALRARAERDRKAAQAAVADAFEAQVASLIDALAGAAREMKDTADAMAEAAGVTRDRSSSVAGAAVQTSANVQMVATASEELAATVQEIARQVERSRLQAQDAITDCATSTEVVGQLKDSTARITEVVGIIAGIAAQTNLLALNATIEAARAGEAGKGFAVVAGEVKALATQTARATEDVTAQVQRIQALGERTVAAIAGMQSAITGMADIAMAIASAVEEQTAATREVARGINEAATGTEDMSRDITQVSAAAATTGSAATQIRGTSGKLAEHADVLTGAVERFLGTVRAA